MYEEGEGVAKSTIDAAKYYRKAADQDHLEAQCNLAIAYAKGAGVPKDLVQAYAWWSVARIKPEARQDLEAAKKQMSPEQIASGEKLGAELAAKIRKQ